MGGAAKMPSRRSFLAASTAAATTMALPWASRGARAGVAGGPSRVLLVLELAGGNDGLNTVVPLRHDRYLHARPTLRVSPGAAHSLDDEFSLHPSLSGLADCYEKGSLAVVQAVGYESPNRSHFESRDIWHSARQDPQEGRRSGWLGRVADWMVARDPAMTPAMVVGEQQVPLALTGLRCTVPVIRDLKSLERIEDPTNVEVQRRLARELEAGAGEALRFLRQSTRQTLDQQQRLKRAVATYESAVDYPATALGRRLQDVAKFLIGGFPCPILYVQQGGYDTHAFQGPVHAALLRELDGALSAFQQDLEEHGLADRVTTLVHSEFGRRVKENGSRGTDHGAGGPCLLLSPAVAGGIHGTRQVLDDLEEGDVRARMDFRSLYTAVLEDWLQVPAEVALARKWPKPKLFA